MGWMDFMTAKKGLEESNRLKLGDYAKFPEDVGQPDVGRLMAALNRGAVAGTLGAPADIGNELMRPFGYGQEKPILGSEWIGDKMQQAGIVPKERDPAAEMAAGFVDPLSGVGSALKLAKGLPAVAGIFAGKGAKLADMEGLLRAEQLLAKGHDPATVWKETGWGVGPDGKWRFEIPDDELLTTPMKVNTFYPGVDKVIDHPELFSQYPDAGQIGLTASKNPGGSYFSGDGPDRMVVDYRDEGDTIMHELQHAVQEREGFAKGGSPFGSNVSFPIRDQFRAGDSVIRKDGGRWLMDYDGKSMEIPEESAVRIWAERGENDYKMDHYTNLAGEAESRLTQSRLNLTPQERLSQYPWEPDYFQKSTGVPVDKLIYK